MTTNYYINVCCYFSTMKQDDTLEKMIQRELSNLRGTQRKLDYSLIFLGLYVEYLRIKDTDFINFDLGRDGSNLMYPILFIAYALVNITNGRDATKINRSHRQFVEKEFYKNEKQK